MKTRVCTYPNSQPVASADCAIEPKVYDVGYMHSHPTAKHWWEQSLVERLASARNEDENGEEKKSQADRIYAVETALALAARELRNAATRDVATLVVIARRVANALGDIDVKGTHDYPYPDDCSSCFTYVRHNGGPPHGPCREHKQTHCSADSCF